MHPVRKASREKGKPLFFKKFISGIAGDEAAKVVEGIGEGATDEEVEKRTGIKLADVRSILNHLHSYGVVEYNREKNLTTGWFTYTWRVNQKRALDNFVSLKMKELGDLKKLHGEGAMIYSCRKSCDRHSFDTAMENKFKCPSCNSELKQFDLSSSVKKLEKEVQATSKLLELV
jgi:transcription factor E